MRYTDGILECEDENGFMFENRFKELYKTLRPFNPRDKLKLLLKHLMSL